MHLIEDFKTAPETTKLIVGLIILRVLLLIVAVMFLINGFVAVFYWIAVGSFILTMMTMFYGFKKRVN